MGVRPNQGRYRAVMRPGAQDKMGRRFLSRRPSCIGITTETLRNGVDALRRERRRGPSYAGNRVHRDYYPHAAHPHSSKD
jgi:hypothetical protein